MKRINPVFVVMLPLALAWAGCEKQKADLCGNGIQDRGETCDGSSVGNQTCQGLGFAGGVLGCNDYCDGYDTGACIMAICGNGKKEPGEVCDTDDFAGQSCTTLAMGFAGGDLACESDCSGLITTGCYYPDVGGIAGMVSVEATVTCDASNISIDCAGAVYVALFRNDPVIQPHQVPVASSVVYDAALSGDASEVAYSVTNVPEGTWYLTAFLDDNANADLTAERADPGDPTLEPFQVTVTKDNVTVQDLVLTERKE